jgi:hypothetical protein
MSLTFLEDSHLTITTLMNLREVRPRNVGIFPYGMPAYLAFFTDCIRPLLGK